MPPDLWRNGADIHKRIPVQHPEGLRKVASLLFQSSSIPKCHLKIYQRLIFRNSLLFCTKQHAPWKGREIVLLLCPRFIVLQIPAPFVWSWITIRYKGAVLVASFLGERRKDSSRPLSDRGTYTGAKGPWRFWSRTTRVWILTPISNSLETCASHLTSSYLNFHMCYMRKIAIMSSWKVSDGYMS